jgi:enoyl-CoA hydratase/carnithine racemase
MGLVEIGAGLVPGGCGMINLWRRVIESKPVACNLTDMAGYFIPAFMNVAQAKVGMSAMEARNNGYLKTYRQNRIQQGLPPGRSQERSSQRWLLTDM